MDREKSQREILQNTRVYQFINQTHNFYRSFVFSRVRSISNI